MFKFARYALVLCYPLMACGSTGASAKPAAMPERATEAGKPTSEASPGEVNPSPLARQDIAELPGFESRLYVLEYPPGMKAEPRSYTEQCVGYVLQGRAESAFGNSPATVASAGDSFLAVPHELEHFRNPDAEKTLRIAIAGTFHKDEPLFQLSADAANVTPASAASPPAAQTHASETPGTAEQRLTEVKRTLLVHRTIADLPGLESRLYLVEFPRAAESKLHLHTAQGIGYVLEGSFESAFGSDPPAITHTGEAFVDQTGRPHHFRNPDAAKQLRFIVAGTYHQDEALFQPVAK